MAASVPSGRFVGGRKHLHISWIALAYPGSVWVGPVVSAGFSLMKDLSGDSKATITTASKLVLTGGIVSGKLDGETTRILSYEIPNIPGDDGPYEVMVGYRRADPVSQNELTRGVGLQLGSK